MFHLAWTLRGTRLAQSRIDLKTGWILRRKRMYRRRMSPRRCPMTGDKQNPAGVPGFLCMAAVRVIVHRGQACTQFLCMAKIPVGAGLPVMQAPRFA